MGKGSDLHQKLKGNLLSVHQVTGIFCITTSAATLCYNFAEGQKYLLQKKKKMILNISDTGDPSCFQDYKNTA